MQSDTPRTDAAEYEEDTGYNGIVKVVSPDFARELERENTKARELLADVLFYTVTAGPYPDGPCLERWLRDDIKAFLSAAKAAPAATQP